MPPSPDDDAPDLQALFDQTTHPSTQAQHERWARHAATLPDRPPGRRWGWLLPAIVAAVAAFVLWPVGPGPVADGLDLATSDAPTDIGPVPAEEMGGLELLLAAADDTASLDEDPTPVEDPPRVRAEDLSPSVQDPLRVLDGAADPMAPLEMLSPPARPGLQRQLDAFASPHDAEQAPPKPREKVGQRNQKPRARLARVKKQVLENRVGLTSEEADAVLKLFVDQGESRRTLRRRLRQSTRALKRLIAEDSRDEAAYSAALDDLMRSRADLFAHRERQLKALEELLTARKRARLLATMRKVQRRMHRRRGDR